MSEDTKGQAIQTTETQQSTGGATDTHTGDDAIADYERKLSDLAAENKKYRQSYVKFKSELEQSQAQIRELQESSMREQGKYKDLYEKSIKELQSERERRLADRQQWTGHVVTSRLAAEAVKLGCQDPLALVKIATADGVLSREDLVSDDTFEINQDVLTEIVQGMKKQHDKLFARTTPHVKDGIPKTNAKVTKQDLSSMKLDDLIQMAKTQFN